MAIVDAGAAFHKYFGSSGNTTPAQLWSRLNKEGSVDSKTIESWCQARTPQEQFELDVAFWYGTLCSFGGSREKRLMVQRIFATLYFGGLIYKRHGIWMPWWDSRIPIASALSHGGRIVIQTPIGDGLGGDISFWAWLWAGNDPEANRRKAATHDAVYLNTPEKVLHTLKYWKELSTKTSGSTARHYGINIACGGFGNVNPISGNAIVDDGEHGHLYLGYVPATDKRQGYIMIGCEDSAPTDRYTGTHKAWFKLKGGIPVPYRGKAAYGQTGHAHTWGESGHFSVTGGKKWGKLGRGIGGTDAMFVDLAAGWDHVRYGEFYAEDVGSAGIYDFSYAMITLDKWKKISKEGKLHKRPDLIKQIDALISNYERSKQRDLLRQISELCTRYLNDSKRNKDLDKPVGALQHLASAMWLS